MSDDDSLPPISRLRKQLPSKEYDGPLDLNIDDLIDPSLLPAKSRQMSRQRDANEKAIRAATASTLRKLNKISAGSRKSTAERHAMKSATSKSPQKLPPVDSALQNTVDSIVKKAQNIPPILPEKPIKKNPIKIPGSFPATGRILLPSNHNNLMVTAAVTYEKPPPPVPTDIAEMENRIPRPVSRMMYGNKERSFDFLDSNPVKKETVSFPLHVVSLEKEPPPDSRISQPLIHELPPLVLHGMPIKIESKVAVEVGDTSLEAEKENQEYLSRPRTRSKTLEDQLLEKFITEPMNETVESIYRSLYNGIMDKKMENELVRLEIHEDKKENMQTWISFKAQIREKVVNTENRNNAILEEDEFGSLESIDKTDDTATKPTVQFQNVDNPETKKSLHPAKSRVKIITPDTQSVYTTREDLQDSPRHRSSHSIVSSKPGTSLKQKNSAKSGASKPETAIYESVGSLKIDGDNQSTGRLHVNEVEKSNVSIVGSKPVTAVSRALSVVGGNPVTTISQVLSEDGDKIQSGKRFSDANSKPTTSIIKKEAENHVESSKPTTSVKEKKNITDIAGSQKILVKDKSSVDVFEKLSKPTTSTTQPSKESKVAPKIDLEIDSLAMLMTLKQKEQTKKEQAVAPRSDLFLSVHSDPKLTMEGYINPFADESTFEKLDRKQTRVVHAIRENNLGEASRIVDEQIALDYGKDWAFWLRHVVNLQSGSAENALFDICTLSDRYPMNFPLRVAKARLQIACEKKKEALYSLNMACKLRPTCIFSFIESAKIHEELEDLPQALNYYRTALVLEDENPFVLHRLAYVSFRLKQYNQMIEYMDTYLKKNRGLHSDFCNRGIVHTLHKRWDAAYSDYCMAVKLNPFDSTAFRLRGMLLRKRNPYKAIDDFTTALTLDAIKRKTNDDSKLYFYRGCCYMQLRNFKCATEDFEKSVETGRLQSQPAHKNLVILFYKEFKDYKKALEMVIGYLKKYPHDASAYILKNQILLRTAVPRYIKYSFEKDNYDKALWEMTKYIHLKPSDPIGYLMRARIFMIISEKKQAISDLKRSLILMNNNIDFVYQIGLVNLILGDFSNCVKAMTNFHQRLDDNSMIILSRAYKHLGNPEKALDMIYYVPVNHPERDFHVGVALYDAEKYIEALPTIKKAQTIKKFHDSVLLYSGWCKLHKKMLPGVKDLKLMTRSKYRTVQLLAQISLALYYESKGSLQKALNLYDTILEEYKFSQRVYMLKGLLEFKRGHYEQALKNFKEIKRATGQSFLNLTYYTAICKHKTGDYEGAIRYYSALLLHDLWVNIVYRNRGLAYWAQGKLEYAWPDLMEAIKYYPNNDDLVLLLGNILLTLGKKDLCLQVYSTFLKNHEDCVSVLMARGDSYTQFQNWLHAAHDYFAITTVNPRLLAAHLKLIYVYRISGRYINAMNHIEMCSRKFPKSDDIYAAKGVTLVKMAKFNEALTAFNRAIALNNENSEALVNRGILYQGMGSPALAVQDYKACLRSDPDNIAALYNAGSLYLAHGQWEFALKTLDRLLHVKEYANARLNRGITKYLLKDFTGALEDMEKSVLMEPESYIAHLNLAQLYDKLEKYQESVSEYKICMKLKPEMQVEIDKMLSTLALKYNMNGGLAYDAKIHLMNQHFQN